MTRDGGRRRVDRKSDSDLEVTIHERVMHGVTKASFHPFLCPSAYSPLVER